jgi:hypothetical protein
MKKELVIQVDVDGVLADYVYGFRRVAASLYGSRIAVYGQREQQEWAVFDGLTAEDVARVTRVIAQDVRFWQELPPLASPRELHDLYALHLSGHRIYFVTNRYGRHVKAQTETWLHYHTGITRPTVIVSALKGMAARVLMADFSIEDNADNAIDIAAAEFTRSYILTRPYNASAAVYPRVDRLEDFFADVEDYASRRQEVVHV